MASITLHLGLRSELGLRIQIADGLTGHVNIAPFLYEGYCYSRWLLRRGSRWIRAGLRASYKKVFLQAGDYSVGGGIRDRYSARACLPTEKAMFQVMATSTGLSSQLGGGRKLGGKQLGKLY